MSDMIERVAKAIRSGLIKLGVDDIDPDEMSDIARAAIEAMREPTEDMIGAAANYQSDCYYYNELPRYWQAMIDAALS